MAKSPTEQIRDLLLQIGILKERDVRRCAEIRQLKTAIENDRIAHKSDIDSIRELIEKERETRVASDCENAALKQQLQDHLAQYQEWDRRRWGLIVLLIATVLSLASGLIVALARK